MEGTFTASVQYGDWNGSAAADEAVMIGLRRWLDDRKLSNGEFLIGVEMSNAENGKVLAKAYVRALFVPASSHEEARRFVEENAHNVPVRLVSFEMDVAECFCSSNVSASTSAGVAFLLRDTNSPRIGKSVTTLEANRKGTGHRALAVALRRAELCGMRS